MWVSLIFVGHRLMPPGPWSLHSNNIIAFLQIQAGYLIYFFITWNDFIIDIALKITSTEYIESLTKSKIKAHWKHLPDH